MDQRITSFLQTSPARMCIDMEAETLGGWWEDCRLKNLNTTKREDRSLRGSEFKRKIRAEVEKAQTEDRKGSLLSVNLHHKTPWPLAAIKDLREVLMRWGPPTNHAVSHTYISFLLLLGILRVETERDMLALFACSPGFIRSDAASALLDARWKYRR